MTGRQQTYRIGSATITRVAELALGGFKPASLFPDWDARVIADHPGWLPTEVMDAAREHLMMSVHAWLVQDGGRTILVDTGAGNDKQRPQAPYFHRLNNPFLERLHAIGVAPEDVDYVLLTHLHVDHVGWNTRLEDGHWVPTFPNARYVFSRVEREYFTDPRNCSERNKTSFQVQTDSIDPIIAAGQAEMIDVDGGEKIEGFSFHPTPGHSIAHASIVMRSAGEEALFAGDVLHHPIEVYKPEWNTIFDAFAEATRLSRLWALNYAAGREAILFSSHFPGSSAGRVLRDGPGFRWRFS